MSAIVFLKDKKSGTVYEYESISHWDKDKKQSRAKRKCIGKGNPIAITEKIENGKLRTGRGRKFEGWKVM